MNDYKTTIHGVIINYELLGKVLMAKQIRMNNPIDEDINQYRKRILSLCKTVYPDGRIIKY